MRRQMSRRLVGYFSMTARCSRLATAVLLGLVLLLTGCELEGGNEQWGGPHMLSASAVDNWTFKGREAKRITTAHYVIYTTIQDATILGELPQLMEGALTQYQMLAADVPLSSRPLDCYIFATRGEWELFTREHTGKDSKIYLQIRKGGYTVGDRFVAYYIGQNATSSVAAHEGWHQFLSRHLKGRLPPFLEEGIACMFEGVIWQGDLPRWNLAINHIRSQELRKSLDNKKLWPLEKLVAMHAGEIVDKGGDKIEAFYAQCWAFARFLWEAEDGRYRPALKKWLADTAAGRAFDPTGSHNHPTIPWDSAAVKPMVEHYLEMKFEDLEKAYLLYIDKIAYVQYDQQW